MITSGDGLFLMDRPHPDWPLARRLRAMYVDRLDQGALEGIAALGALSASWRALAAKRLQRRAVEDWAHRLDGSRSDGRP